MPEDLSQLLLGAVGDYLLGKGKFDPAARPPVHDDPADDVGRGNGHRHERPVALGEHDLAYLLRAAQREADANAWASRVQNYEAHSIDSLR